MSCPALQSWVEVEGQLVDEYHAVHSCGRGGAIESVQHDCTTSDVGDEGDECVVAAGQLGPRDRVPVLEIQHRASGRCVVLGVRDTGARSDRCLHHGLMEPPFGLSPSFFEPCPRERSWKLVAFSCKRRGFCPSCGARRMAETAVHLVEHVLPEQPIRQWVGAVAAR